MINKEQIIQYIMGDVTPEFLISFYIFTLIGLVLSMLFHYSKKKVKEKKKGNKDPFSFKFWLKDNVVRLFTNIICIFILVRFYDQLPVNYELNMFLGIITGGSLDQLIVLIRNKTGINVFQAK